MAITSGAHTEKIEPSGDELVKVAGKNRMVVKIGDLPEVKYKGSEPGAVIAFLIPKDGSWETIFIADR